MASPALESGSGTAVLRKRSLASHLHNNGNATESFLSDSYGTVNKRPCQIDQLQNYPASPPSSSSSCSQSSCVSTWASPLTEEGDGTLEGESPSLLQAVEWGVTAFAETADSSTGNSLFSASAGGDEVDCSLSSRPEQTRQQLRRTLSQGAEICCDGEKNQADISCFLLEGWEDIDNAGGIGFDPATVFHSEETAGLPADCSDDATFTGCSAENENWFLNDLESESNAFLNEVLDQEWMAVAVANLDRINESWDADTCMLHLLESGAGF